jgi:hypothetical protein
MVCGFIYAGPEILVSVTVAGKIIVLQLGPFSCFWFAFRDLNSLC